MSTERPESGTAASAPLRAPLGTRLLRHFLRLAPNERNRLFILTIVIGVACGLAAVAFHAAIRFSSHALIGRIFGTPGYGWVFWALVTPTLGALLAGILLEYVVPNGRGSGIPQVKLVYAVKSGRLRMRDAFGKFAVASLQLGTGSALGREGPTVQICATVSSALGRLFAISPNNMRRLIPVGAAAGIAAAFNAPIAAVTFTIEEIVGDLDQTVLSGVVVAAAVAAAVEHSILGEHPVFSVPGHYRLEHASSLLVYALLGVAAAVLARLFYGLLLSLRARFRSARLLPRPVMPVVGGIATGTLAVVVGLALGVQGVLGDGYAALSAALVGDVSLHVMAVLVVAKVLATSLCYSSGGAGGIFAPVLFIGGMLGGVLGHFDRTVLGHAEAELGAFALVGMGAFFAAVIRAPITSVLIIFEMTRGYGLILPLMIANAVAYVLARAWNPVPIYEALLEQDGFHLPQTHRAVSALGAFRVCDAMTTELVTLSDRLSVANALEHIQGSEYSIYPVIGADGALHGLASAARLRRSVAEGRAEAPVQTVSRTERYLSADMPLVDAVTLMSELGARQMAVVQGDDGKLVGVLAMSDVMRAHMTAARGVDAGGEPPTSSSTRPAVRWKPRDASISVAQRPSKPGDDGAGG